MMKWLPVALLLGSAVCLLGMPHAEGGSREHIQDLRPLLRSRRMVGGMLAPQVPWQAMVYIRERGAFSGGALIADRWVLTAGRNLFVGNITEDTRKEPTVPEVYLGISHTGQANASTGAAVEKVFLHPGFQNASEWDNDLALIQLKEPVRFSESVLPIPLPETGQDLTLKEGDMGVVAGWGWGIHFTHAESLKYLALPLAALNACQAEYQAGGQVLASTPAVSDRMLCTGATVYRENVCLGDAGGALAFLSPTDHSVYAAGILSFDKSCSTEKYAVYTKISAYLPWIHSVMRGDSERSSALRASVMERLLSEQE